MNTQNITSLDESCYEAMNITNFINIFTNIYIPTLYVAKITQNKNDSIN